jgi:selenophosphate synthetase-related protein
MAYFVQQERKTTKNAPVHWNFNMRRKQKSFAEQLDSSRSAFLAVLGEVASNWEFTWENNLL